MAEPEQALFLHVPPETLPPGIARLYAGAEFCPWRFPATAELRRLLALARERRLAFTLVTPVLIEPQRTPLYDQLALLLPEFGAADEVVISDWGTLDLVRELRPETTVVLGRVLSGQKRDARTVALDLGAAQAAHFRQGSWYSAPAAGLLRELGIRRVELDNLLQGLDPLPASLQGTLHVPYAMVASSRNCPFRRPGSARPCPRPCGEVFTLRAADCPVPLLQGGNTQFLCNERLPEDLAALGIDRVVAHSELPR
ncbi:MAG: hypothetical protein FDZ69_13415 [Deltaproteobacteria bacterium]|nr:MAG: hypothetical protein FDZ69_13415 [Deltaproteobacteria bacterium]